MLIVGNWKMNVASMAEFGETLARAPEATARGVDLIVCPPVVLLHRLAARAATSPVRIGAQDAHYEEAGAFTGDVSARMVAEAGGTAVILGHSERRIGWHESDALVALKAAAVQRAGLTAIVCVGETETERDAGDAERIVTGQVAASLPRTLDASALVVAYEPVWAIGSGRLPSANEIAAMHLAIRRTLMERFPAGAIPILYGGSVNPATAAEILAVANVDGALVGGASLKADDFIAIARAAPCPPSTDLGGTS